MPKTKISEFSSTPANNTDAFDTEEEAKAYLVTIYRLESTT